MTVTMFGQPIRIMDSMSFLWQFHDIFFKGSYFFKTNESEPVIIDCGSNIGMSVIFFKREFPNSKIVAFEPDPDVFQILKTNTRIYSGVTCFQKAIWTHSRGTYLSRDFADGGHITHSSDCFVQSVRLKEELGRFDRVDLLKLDIEGAEFDVIEDCEESLFKVDKIFIEAHTFSGGKQKLGSLITILERAGFRYYIENENFQKKPLRGEWKVNYSGMDVQLNIFAVRNR